MRTQDPREPSPPEIVPGNPAPWPPPAPPLAPLPAARSGGRWVAVGVVIVLFALVALAVNPLIRLPYDVESPGSAPSVIGYIATDASHRHPVKGDVLLSTVSLTDSVSPLELVRAWFNPNQNIVARTQVTGGLPSQQFNQQSVAEMSQSKQDALVVAFRRLGYPVTESGDGVLVQSVNPGTPADGKVLAGDVIVKADGKPVHLAQDLVADIRAHPPGTTITLDFTRPSVGPRTASVVLTSCPPDVCSPGTPKTSFLGIAPVTDHDHFSFPFNADIKLDDVGGPSAGLAFTLGLLDALSTGNLTGGHRVAATGTIDAAGNVGPIGGIALKTVAVERAKADIFLVPKDAPQVEPQFSAAAAKARGHHLRVIAVANLDDALRALQSVGGDLRGIALNAQPTRG